MRQRDVAAGVAGVLTAGLVALSVRLDAPPPIDPAREVVDRIAALHRLHPDMTLGARIRGEQVLTRRPCGINRILGATRETAEGYSRDFRPRLDLTLYAVPHAAERFPEAERALVGCTDPGYPTPGKVRLVGDYVIYTGGDNPDAEALADDVERALRDKGLA